MKTLVWISAGLMLIGLLSFSSVTLACYHGAFSEGMAIKFKVFDLHGCKA